MSTQTKKLDNILVAKKLISGDQLAEVQRKRHNLKLSLAEAVTKLNYITEDTLLEVFSSQFGIEFFNLAENDFHLVDTSLSFLLPRHLCQQLQSLPVFYLNDDDIKELTLAMVDPLDQAAMAIVKKRTGCNITPVLITSSAFSGGLKKLFGTQQSSQLQGVDFQVGHDQAAEMVNKFLFNAVKLNASDIHIEPHEKEAHVRIRIDGVLQLAVSIASSMVPLIVSRIKVMASEKNSLMKIEERRLPQDGSFARLVNGHEVDFRVSTLPTIYGEKVVVRILNKNNVSSIHKVSDLHMPKRIERQFLRSIHQVSGIIIATGPTGSGKSTTLYSAIKEISNVNTNIVTVEDPVEYRSGGYVNQSSLMPQAGYTYAKALTSILRQDPDVILIGEIRDLDTAKIAIQSALTGHLVLTTLHTDDAAGAVVRLVDLGIEQFLVSSTVVSALNQRLVRKICKECVEEYLPAKSEMMEYGVDEKVADEILDDPLRFDIRNGRGCAACGQTGYQGRRAVYELLRVTPAIKKMILGKETSDVIAENVRKLYGINMLFEDGLRLVLKGETTFEELKKIPRGDYVMKSVAEIFKAAS